MRIWKIGAAFLAILALSLIAIACGGEKSSDEPYTLHVELREWGVKLQETEVPAGDVTVSVTNYGTIEHEVVILKTDVPADQLEIQNSKVEESNYGEVGEVEDVAPGESKSVTFHLEPGKYVFICNIAGHYMVGMHTPLTVK